MQISKNLDSEHTKKQQRQNELTEENCKSGQMYQLLYYLRISAGSGGRLMI